MAGHQLLFRWFVGLGIDDLVWHPTAFHDQPRLAREAMIGLVHGRTVRCEPEGTRTYDRCAGVCYLDRVEL